METFLPRGPSFRTQSPRDACTSSDFIPSQSNFHTEESNPIFLSLLRLWGRAVWSVMSFVCHQAEEHFLIRTLVWEGLTGKGSYQGILQSIYSSFLFVKKVCYLYPLPGIWKLVLLYVTICSYRLAEACRPIFSWFDALLTAFLLFSLRNISATWPLCSCLSPLTKFIHWYHSLAPLSQDYFSHLCCRGWWQV